MKKKRILATLLAAVLLLSGCSLEKTDSAVDAKQTVIEVNGAKVTKAEFNNNYSYNYYIQSYYAQIMAQFGSGDGTVDAAEVLQDTISGIEETLVLNQKAAELGFDQYTDDDMIAIKESAQTSYESNLASVQSNYFADTELTGDALTEAVKAKADELGYTLDYFISSAKSTETSKRLKASVTDLVTISDEQLQAALDEKIEAEKTAYAADITAYGTSANAGKLTYYTPAGYRSIKVITVTKPTAAEGETFDVSTAKAEIDAIAVKATAGEDFDTLSDNLKAYVVTTGSTDVLESIVTAAMALTEKGAVSEVIENETDFILIKYVDDLAEASADLEVARANLYVDMLSNAQSDAYNAAVTSWMNAADIKVYTDRIN